MAGGVALGPVLSGLLLNHFWWGSVFLINVPAMVLLLVLARCWSRSSATRSPARFDLLERAVLSLGAVLPVIYGIKELAADGLGRSARAAHRRRALVVGSSSSAASAPARRR